jgi:hypothetical protein
MLKEVYDVFEKIRNTEDFFEKAKLIQYLQVERKITTKKVSEELSMKPSYLCHITRLNKLPEIVIDGYYSKLISVSHLFIIARLNDLEHMMVVYEKALAGNLTVLQTEEMVREYLYNIKADGNRLSNEELEQLREKIKSRFKSVSIKVVQTRVKAKVVLELKGNLKKTSQTLKDILDTLSS